ncbi:MAG: DNA internalization-related competence protein ComEC/Rec2 [bacterium]|nr:DNA internalization-related competence protein ComEC/Rec2 [bacterium]
MVRRPLLLVLTAFILGSLVYEMPILLFLLAGIGFVVITVIFLMKVSKNRQDQILLIMPVFFFLGYLMMNNQRQPGPLDQAFETSDAISVSISGTVHSIQTSSTSYKVILSNVQYDTAEGQSDYIMMYTKDVSDLAIGNCLLVKGKLSKFRSPTNKYQFDEQMYYKNQNIDYKIIEEQSKVIDDHVDRLSDTLYGIRLRLCSVLATISEEEVASSLSAMLLGEKSSMDKETKSLYELGGIAHIISISGLHVALFGMAVFTFLRNIAGLKTGVVTSIFFIFCYGILTNFSVSTNRAVIMLMLFLAAKIAGRTYDLVTAVALSGILILLRQPMQVYQCGFLLSYGAVIGIAVVYPCFLNVIDLEKIKMGKEWEEKERGPVRLQIRNGYLAIRYYVITSFLYQLAIFVVTLPILLYFYYKVATYSFLLNLIVLPLMTYVVLFGILGACLGCISLPLGMFFLAPAIYVIRFYLFLCRLVERMPFHQLVLGRPDLLRLIIYIVLVLLGCIGLYRKYRLCACLLAAGVMVFLIPNISNDLMITSVDVGQGDCFVIQAPKGKVYMIDGGSTSESEVGEYRVLPYLYGSGINRIDDIFVTHADKDHVSAVEELLMASAEGKVTIGHLIVSHTSFKDENYDKLVEIATQCNVEVCYMELGQKVTVNDLSFTCLHPTYEYVPESANDYSLVLSLEYKDFSMLCTGDLSSKGEDALLANNMQSYDVLKVGHHGSKYSTSIEFLNVIHPKVAIISCGKNNQYGHPHKELIERLKEKVSDTYITTDTGMITIKTDGERIIISPYIT